MNVMRICSWIEGSVIQDGGTKTRLDMGADGRTYWTAAGEKCTTTFAFNEFRFIGFESRLFQIHINYRSFASYDLVWIFPLTFQIQIIAIDVSDCAFFCVEAAMMKTSLWKTYRFSDTAIDVWGRISSPKLFWDLIGCPESTCHQSRHWCLVGGLWLDKRPGRTAPMWRRVAQRSGTVLVKSHTDPKFPGKQNGPFLIFNFWID